MALILLFTLKIEKKIANYPQVFQVIKSERPDILAKVTPIVGDCVKPGLGISETDKELIKNEVNVIFHVAATVRFDAPLRQAVNMNIRSTSDLLDIAADMKKLKVRTENYRV